MCESSTHVDDFSVAHDVFLDDAFRRLAAKNQLSHCIKRAHSHREYSKQETQTSRVRFVAVNVCADYCCVRRAVSFLVQCQGLRLS
jgi:hypothetical protein